MSCITQHGFLITQAKMDLSHRVIITWIFEKVKKIELSHNWKNFESNSLKKNNNHFLCDINFQKQFFWVIRF
jgi:hypothetical protein